MAAGKVINIHRLHAMRRDHRAQLLVLLVHAYILDLKQKYAYILNKGTYICEYVDIP